MKLKYLGHSAFYMETETVKLLIDPFLTGNPVATEKAEVFYNVDYIFVTHGHRDHLGDSIEIAKASGATIVTNFEIANYLSQFDVACHPMHIGGRFKFDFGRVKMTPALHGSGIQTEHGTICGGNAAGFLIELDGVKVYHAGDTGLTMDMKLLKEEAIDIALLPIGGNYTMDIEDALRATRFIAPKHVMPMHYDTFDLIKADPTVFIKALPEEVEGRVLKIGELFELNA